MVKLFLSSNLNNMNNKLFVGGISFDSSEESMSAFFADAGEVLSVKIIMDRETGRSRGFGFVEMATEEAAEKAIEMLNETELDGRKLHISIAKPQERRERREF